MKPYLLNPLHPPKTGESGKDTWRPLGFLNLYRTSISGVFLILLYSENTFTPLASHDVKLFFAVTVVYFALSIVFWLLMRWRAPRFKWQVVTHILTDIIATTLLMHASGGVLSGLGTLMVITIAGGSIMIGGRAALFFASIATIAILLEQLYVQVILSSQATSYIQAGILGLTFFATAILANALSRRIRESETLARERGVDLANMAQLTEHIIQRMQTGIIVVDQDNQIRLMNESAWYMLGMPATSDSTSLGTLSEPLAEQVISWKNNPQFPRQVIHPSLNHANVMPAFARIGEDENTGALIFLEDTSAMAQKAQQLQLASLGRLTASIAHEIRNPLGAISHAGQLLAESKNMDKHDQRLTQIIDDQSRRMNTIVENVMQLGRRGKTRTELITLEPFLQQFMSNFTEGQNCDTSYIRMDVQPSKTQVRFDRSHLEQILTNLCDNGLRHSASYSGHPKIELQSGISVEFSRPYLDIIDHGPGIDPLTAEHIFEPFFTTESSGTGLGLYICRELAECNQAHINYIESEKGGSRFRITFQDPRRQMN